MIQGLKETMDEVMADLTIGMTDQPHHIHHHRQPPLQPLTLMILLKTIIVEIVVEFLTLDLQTAPFNNRNNRKTVHRSTKKKTRCWNERIVLIERIALNEGIALK
jgi:hypothetical protein